jgi:D-glycero-D-manno-heptose 1,7-bisphosphate phosphatase
LKKAVFLDRDGVINAMVYDQDHGLIDSPANPEQFRLLPNVGEAIRLINDMGLLALVVSNQPGVAKGKFTPEVLQAIDRKMETELASYEAHLDGIYYCLHHPEAALEEYRGNCNCRKPNPGLILRGSKEFNVDLERSYMVGDGLTDIQAGKAAGVKTILLGNLRCDLCKLMDELDAKPDFIVPDLLEAVKLIQNLEKGE